MLAYTQPGFNAIFGYHYATSITSVLKSFDTHDTSFWEPMDSEIDTNYCLPVYTYTDHNNSY